MEALGWVVRQSDPNDRRVRRVMPTPKALEAHAFIKTIADDVYAEALAGIPPEHRKLLMDALATVTANLAKAETVGQKELS